MWPQMSMTTYANCIHAVSTHIALLSQQRKIFTHGTRRWAPLGPRPWAELHATWAELHATV